MKPAAAADGRPAAAAGAAGDNRPPRLTGGEQKTQIPLAGEQKIDWAAYQESEYFKTFVTNQRGKLIEIPLRKGREDGALIDYLTFTFRRESLIEYFKNRIIGDNEYIVVASEMLQKIFGYGLTKKMPGKGKFFYQGYYQVGPDNAPYGTLHYGGQRDTVLVDLTGTGCQAAKPGWEVRLYQFLQVAINARITRCDVAHDFFNGEYTPEQGISDHAKGLYDNHNIRPKIERRGTAWMNEDNTGKTLYIGRKGSSKLLRIYEKGKKFGDENSPGFVSKKNSENTIADTHRYFAVSRQYLTGAFPIGEQLFTTPASRIETKTQTVNLSFDQKEFHAKNQVGRFVRFLVDIGLPDKEIVKRLCGEENKYPKGLDPSEYDCEAIKTYYLHDEGFKPLDIDQFKMTLDNYLLDDAYQDRLSNAHRVAESLVNQQDYVHFFIQERN
uniref:Replication initiation protein-like C-terminal domain-containing protein n=2 Tax=Eikenella corrodens TaxID=539 RepID=Q4W7Z9_EIKCO|nr:hypothetical protein [Eikenella corrodens]